MELARFVLLVFWFGAMNGHEESKIIMLTKPHQRTETGFEEDTEVGSAILLAEDDDGNTQPIAVASSIIEAREFAESDLRQRRRKLDLGLEPSFCPARYTLWARGIDGDYVLATTFEN